MPVNLTLQIVTFHGTSYTQESSRDDFSCAFHQRLGIKLQHLPVYMCESECIQEMKRCVLLDVATMVGYKLMININVVSIKRSFPDSV